MAARVETVLAHLGIEHAPAKGGWIRASCPYHEDAKQHWRIRVGERRYGQHKCWTCGEGGTLVDLVVHARKLADWRDAKAWLKEIGADAPLEKDMPDTVRVVLEGPSQKRFELPREVSLAPLAEWVTPARRYVERRGVTAEQVEEYRLGYAADGRLGGRIVLPAYSRVRGALRPRSYMARDFTEDPHAQRYLFPMARDGADLDTMFGQHLWPEPADRDVIVATEGGFDALAVERAGDEWSVGALGGSDVRPGHLGKLATFEAVIVLTDNDLAGDKAWRDIDDGLARHVDRVRRVTLPAGTDANNTETSALRELLCSALRSAE